MENLTIPRMSQVESLTITRMGHYHTPLGEGDSGLCRAALVCGVNEDGTVNLAVYDHSGMSHVAQQSVPVGQPQANTEDGAMSTFHLSMSCPFGR